MAFINNTQEGDTTTNLVLEEWTNDVTERKKATETEQRKWDAAFRNDITFEEARTDLMTNQTDPYLFRSYMLQIWKKMTAEHEQSYPVLSDYQNRVIRWECGRHMTKMIHTPTCRMSGMPYMYNPEIDYTFSTVDNDSTRALYHMTGPCSSWPGHIGYCWNGTTADNRACAHTGGGSLPSSPFLLPFRSM